MPTGSFGNKHWSSLLAEEIHSLPTSGTAGGVLYLKPLNFPQIVNSLPPIILLAFSCAIAAGQLLTNTFEPAYALSASWDRERGHGGTSDDSSAYESAKKKAAVQAALSGKEIILDINLPKLSGTSLASIYRTLTGRRVIVSAAAATAEFSLVHEASPRNPVTYAQAAELLKKAATIEGFAFVPDGHDPNLDILKPATSTRIICRGVAVFNENTPLPEGDEVISYIMTLKYVAPKEAVAIFTEAVGEFDPFGSIAVVPDNSIIVATLRTSIIRKLVALKNEIDKP